MAYRYYQVGQRDDWILVDDEGQAAEAKAAAADARKLTILGLNQPVDNEAQDADDLQYSGPLYFDIDNKGDIAAAIASAIELCDKLLELQVLQDDLQIFCSGSKGLHVVVAAKVFSSGRPRKMLPRIYKRMAYHLFVLGMDMQVYSAGRGNAFRLPNTRRPDGNYRTRITYQQLLGLTPEGYRDWVSEPRPLPAVPEPTKAAALKALMERAEKEALRKIQVVEIPPENLKKISDPVPQCALMLSEYKVRQDVNFNEVAFQLAIYISRAQPSAADADTLVARLAAKGSSSQYDSQHRRYVHAKGSVSYALKEKHLKFACGAMRNLLIARPCEGCPIEASLDSASEIASITGIVESPQGTFIAGSENDSHILSFRMLATDLFYEWSPDRRIKRRVGAVFDIVVGAETKYHGLRLAEQHWLSKSAFISAISGLEDCVFLGSQEAEVQKLKLHVFRNQRELGEIVNIYTTGVHYETDVNAPKGGYYVYAEPGWSMSEHRVAGTHVIGGKVPAAPELHKAVPPEKRDRAIADALHNLMFINSPEVVGQVLGWFMACHLKVQFMRNFKQFPLLSLWGNAEAGKTMTASLMACLNGCDLLGTGAVVNVSKTTDFALFEQVSTSTTIPRVLEEYNKSKMQQNHRYDTVGEVLKSAFNGLSYSRGSLSKGSTNGNGRLGNAHTIDIPIVAPIVTTSEQAPLMPALRQRSVQVLMSQAARKKLNCDGPFMRAQAAREQLRQFARHATLSALQVADEDMAERLHRNDDLLPEIHSERAMYGQLVVLAGLDFFAECCASLELGLDEVIATLKASTVEWLRTNHKDIDQAKDRSEVDAMMETVLMMIAQSKATQGVAGSQDMVAGAHYKINGDKLLLSLHVVHTLYRLRCRSLNEPAVIDSWTTLRKLLQQEPYFVDENHIEPGSFNGRKVWVLDMGRMRDKGLPVDAVQ